MDVSTPEAAKELPAYKVFMNTAGYWYKAEAAKNANDAEVPFPSTQLLDVLPATGEAFSDEQVAQYLHAKAAGVVE